MPSDVELAWTAGLLDGDGTITLNVYGGPQHSVFRKPMVCVDNTDREILEELQRLYGGKLIAKKKTQEHHRQAWSWRVFGADNIIAMLRQVHPYMRCRVKAERTRMLVEEYKQVTSRNGHYTPETRAAKVDFEERFLSVGAGRGSRCRPIAEGAGVEPTTAGAATD